MTVECAITRGAQPIGRGVGPILEARDVLAVLAGDGPRDLRVKSLKLAELLLDQCGVDRDAADLLDSGEALRTFRAIVAAQNGDPDVSPEDLRPGGHRRTVAADSGGQVTHVDNRLVNAIARRAGAPKDKAAGLELYHRVGDEVQTGDPLFCIHAEQASKLAEAERLAEETDPVRILEADEALVERFGDGVE
jgi:AMP phosphorylase